MDFQSLRYFVVATRVGSFSRASAQCYVSEPALSRSMKRLEEEYGVRLFERHARGICLTLSGEKFYQSACRVLDACEALEYCMRSAHAARDTLITIGYTTGGEKHYVEELKAVSACLPVTINALRLGPKAGLDELHGGEIDALIINEPMVKGDPSLNYKLLRRSGLNAYVTPSHPLATLETLPIEALSRYRLAAFPREAGEATYDEMIAVIKTNGVSVDIAAYCTSTNSFYVMVDTEQYVGVMLSDSRYALNSNLIKSIPIPAFDGHFNIVLAFDAHSPKVAILRDMTRGEI